MSKIAWSVIDNEWARPQRIVRARRRLDAQAYHLARQLVDGTLPDDGVIVCPDEYSAEQLMLRINVWIGKLTEVTHD